MCLISLCCLTLLIHLFSHNGQIFVFIKSSYSRVGYCFAMLSLPDQVVSFAQIGLEKIAGIVSFQRKCMSRLHKGILRNMVAINLNNGDSWSNSHRWMFAPGIFHTDLSLAAYMVQFRVILQVNIYVIKEYDWKIFSWFICNDKSSLV